MDNNISVNCFEYPGSDMEIRVFEHFEFGNIRTVTINEEIWLSGSDVMSALKHSTTLLNYYVLPEDKMLFKDREAPGLRVRGAGLLLINRHGLQGFLSSGHLSPLKETFKCWMLEEVAPDIRAYSVSIPNKIISFQESESFRLLQKMQQLDAEDKMPTKKWYSCTEIARYYGVTAGTVRSWIHGKKLKAIRSGKNSGKFRVLADDLLVFEQANCTM